MVLWQHYHAKYIMASNIECRFDLQLFWLILSISFAILSHGKHITIHKIFNAKLLDTGVGFSRRLVQYINFVMFKMSYTQCIVLFE